MRRYLVLIRAPHGLRLAAGTAVFYPGQAALGLVLLLALHRATGSFASAGAGVAALTAAFSLSGLAQGRVIDRRGTRALVPMTAVCATAIAAMAAALSANAPAAALIVLAAAIGASIPATGLALHSVWSSLLDDPEQRSTAFAFQSLAQDAGFLIGPAAFGAVTVTVSPQVALACCWTLVATGSLAAATVPAQAHVAEPAGRPVSLLGALAAVAAVMAIVGIALDAVDVSTAAFATEHHRPQLAGVLLACFSVGSIAGALAYGARKWRSAPHVRLLGCTVALGILALGPVAAPSVALGVPAFVLAGLPVGTAITTAFLLAAESAPADRQTEAYALLSLTLNAGAALGGVLAGQLVARGSSSTGFLIVVAGGLLSATLLALMIAGGGFSRRVQRG